MSLRFWIGAAMAASLLPLTLSATVGYYVLNRGVVQPIHDVAYRQREQIDPAQQLRVRIWGTLVPVDEYVEDGRPAHAEAYRKLRLDIESGFAGLAEALAHDQAAASLLERARESWSEADRRATDLISVSVQSGNGVSDAEFQRFHGAIVTTSDRLAAAYKQIADGIDDDHDSAMQNYERSVWIAGIAGGVAILAMIGGVFLIGRIMAASVDRLVEGAARFAKGDRDHRIDVQVPPELHRVASEFNYMIDRIFESEKALDDLAHADSLTGLPNRRAFDRALADVFSRYHRHGEPCCLLAIDIDHFKRVNDTYGHAAGDVVLREAAQLMEHVTRPFDKAYRVGGEEFFIVLPKTRLHEAIDVAERVRNAAETAEFSFEGTRIHCTISIGVAEISDHETPEAMTASADEALYRAKRDGRNRIVSNREQGSPVRRIA